LLYSKKCDWRFFVAFIFSRLKNKRMKHSSSRRFFLKTFAISAAAVTLAPLLKIQSAIGGPVPLTDPLVKALGYVPDATKSPDRKDKNASCKSCQFYLGDVKAKVGKCQLIPSGDVSTSGWCRSYSVKQKKA